jgi:hypothetical protein
LKNEKFEELPALKERTKVKKQIMTIPFCVGFKKLYKRKFDDA